MYSVKQLADLAHVSRRTLHFYDEKGLLTPDSLGEHGYRYYTDQSLYRLQQILLYREMGFSLDNIKKILDKPGFDLPSALKSQRKHLQGIIKRYQQLITTIDSTIRDVSGEVQMDKTKMFEGFDEKTAERYSKEAQERWGDLATQSHRLWKSYSKEKQEEILQEANQVYQNIAKAMDRGPKSPEVQELLKQWHQNLYYFYEPSIELLGGLGNTYYDDPRFRETFEKIHPELPGFLKEAIATYVDTLETEWLERELGILEESE